MSEAQQNPTPEGSPKPEDQGKKPENKPPKSRSKLLIWITLAIIILGIVWFLYWLLYLQYHEYTDDAYANGNLININSPIPGSVTAFFADDTDLVEEGQLLALLDRTAYEVKYEQELAALASSVLQVRQLYDKVKIEKANVESKEALLQKATYDYENRLHLVDSLAISREDFIHAKDDLLVARLALKQAKSQLDAAVAAAGNTTLEEHPILKQQIGAILQAYYNLIHCAIYAPATGYIAKRAVDVGQWVTPTTNLMAIIPTDYVWVDANFKETQLTYMRIGQPATVWFDIYGSKVAYDGKVIGIASGTGSIFSIIPPQNATGNWIKIVQRLPVRISLNRDTLKKYPFRLGISAEVDVNITDQDLPVLAITSSAKSIGRTSIFDIDMSKVNLLINNIISENMKKES